MRRGGRRGEAPPEYLDDDEQEAVIARFEASMQATRDAWMRLLCALSLGCSVGVGVASLLDLPFLPALVHRTTLVTGAFPSSQYAGPVAVAAAASFCLPGIGFYTREHLHRWFAAGAAVPLCAFILILAWSQGTTYVFALLLPVGYQMFCYIALNVLHEPDTSLDLLKTARYHHKKA